MRENNEMMQMAELGFKLGQVIERSLGIPLATLTFPSDLAVTAAAVYAGSNDGDIVFLNSDIGSHLKLVVANYRPDVYARVGTTQEEFLRGYPDLIGNGNYSRGQLAEGLRKAPQLLSQPENEELERMLAELFARYIRLYPDAVPSPNVSIDILSAERGAIRFINGLTYVIQRPGIVVEYGPGLTFLRRIPQELPYIGQSFLIENSMFINQAMAASARLVGVEYPQVITRMDGIVSATNELISLGATGQVDLIIMSMVHSAGKEELEKSIGNAEVLLKQGGALAVQVADQVDEGEASGDFIRGTVKRIFKRTPKVQKAFRYVQQTTGRIRTAHQEVYIK